jgi:hypothetical protein
MQETLEPDGFGWYPRGGTDKSMTSIPEKIVLSENTLECELEESWDDDFSMAYTDIVGFYEQQFQNGGRTNGGAPAKTTGIEIVSKDERHFFLFNKNNGEGGYPDQIEGSFFNELSRKSKDSGDFDLPFKFMLVSPFDSLSGRLRVEEWTGGAAGIEAGIEGKSESEGSSTGIQLGPFSRSSTKSRSSIKGDISGEISDNTFNTKIHYFKIYEDKLFIRASGMNLNLAMSDIKDVQQARNGIILSTETTTFKIEELWGVDTSAVVQFIRKKGMDSSGQAGSDPTFKLRELKKLFEDDIITKAEFEAKKEEVLDDF